MRRTALFVAIPGMLAFIMAGVFAFAPGAAAHAQAAATTRATVLYHS